MAEEACAAELAPDVGEAAELPPALLPPAPAAVEEAPLAAASVVEAGADEPAAV